MKQANRGMLKNALIEFIENYRNDYKYTTDPVVCYNRDGECFFRGKPIPDYLHILIENIDDYNLSLAANDPDADLNDPEYKSFIDSMADIIDEDLLDWNKTLRDVIEIATRHGFNNAIYYMGELGEPCMMEWIHDGTEVTKIMLSVATSGMHPDGSPVYGELHDVDPGDIAADHGDFTNWHEMTLDAGIGPAR